jgi:hypothetical protein
MQDPEVYVLLRLLETGSVTTTTELLSMPVPTLYSTTRRLCRATARHPDGRSSLRDVLHHEGIDPGDLRRARQDPSASPTVMAAPVASTATP